VDFGKIRILLVETEYSNFAKVHGIFEFSLLRQVWIFLRLLAQTASRPGSGCHSFKGLTSKVSTHTHTTLSQTSSIRQAERGRDI
jgi:hypothetical protein